MKGDFKGLFAHARATSLVACSSDLTKLSSTQQNVSVASSAHQMSQQPAPNPVASPPALTMPLVNTPPLGPSPFVPLFFLCLLLSLTHRHVCSRTETKAVAPPLSPPASLPASTAAPPPIGTSNVSPPSALINTVTSSPPTGASNSRQLLLVAANKPEIEAHPQLICGICTNLLWEPQQTACGHVFCARCVRRWIEDASLDGRVAACPVDGSELSAAQPLQPLATANPQLHDTLQNVTVHCPLARLDGCDWTGPYSMALRHQTNECARAWVVCSLAAHGCTERMRRGALSAHMAGAAQAHVSLLLARIEAYETEKQAMQKQVCLTVPCAPCMRFGFASHTSSQMPVCPRAVCLCVRVLDGCGLC
jgi:hypothetical protein